jgi:DNA-binding NtrC family response regulator
MGPIHREESRAEGRELEFIVRSLVEVKLQLEELRRRVDDDRASREAGAVGGLAGSGAGAAGAIGAIGALGALGAGIAPPAESGDSSLPIRSGMTMAEIERTAIVNALRDTRGNRRKAAELLDIGERTLYRKLKEYQVPEQSDE